MNKLKLIVAGWTNLLIPDERVDKIAMERAVLCAECPFAEWSLMATLTIKESKLHEVAGMACSQCGCPLSAKTRSPGAECPLPEPDKKWESINLNNNNHESIRHQNPTRIMGEEPM